jgi:hypothetical protein
VRFVTTMYSSSADAAASKDKAISAHRAGAPPAPYTLIPHPAPRTLRPTPAAYTLIPAPCTRSLSSLSPLFLPLLPPPSPSLPLSDEPEAPAEFAEGLCTYFDTFARARLLYNAAETKQFDRLQKQSRCTHTHTHTHTHTFRLWAESKHMPTGARICLSPTFPSRPVTPLSASAGSISLFQLQK